jgi:hypothetical protein
MTKGVPEEPGVTHEKFDDGTYVGQKYTFANVSLDKMADGQSGDDLRIVHDKAAKRYTVTGTMDLTEIKVDDPTTKAFMGSLDIRISITFPGKVLEHNGELSGTTVTWKPKAGEKTALRAVSEEASGLAALTGGSSSSRTVLIAAVAGGGLLLLVIIVVVVILLARRKKAPAYPTDPYAGQGYPAQGYPAQGYPAQGYPAQGYPAQGGYPAPPGSPAGYPPVSGGGYPPAGYAPAGGGDPQGGNVYGGQQPTPGYPPQQQPQYPAAPQQQQPQYPPTQQYPPSGWPPNQPGA